MQLASSASGVASTVRDCVLSGCRVRRVERVRLRRGAVALANVAISCWRDGLPARNEPASRRANQLHRDVGGPRVFLDSLVAGGACLRLPGQGRGLPERHLDRCSVSRRPRKRRCLHAERPTAEFLCAILSTSENSNPVGACGHGHGLMSRGNPRRNFARADGSAQISGRGPSKGPERGIRIACFRTNLRRPAHHWIVDRGAGE